MMTQSREELFSQYISQEVRDISTILYGLGVKLGLVGGVVRDFFLEKENKHDYDAEIRPIKKAQDISTLFKQVKIELEKKYLVQELAYSVLRVEIGSNQILELTPPRKELYRNETGHSNFDAEFFNDLDYSKGFLRRDFSMNAIMMEFSGLSWKLIDPLNGLEALQRKILAPCSRDFSRDPVRLLRGIRFSLLLDFTLSDDLEIFYQKSSLSHFSPYYIEAEMMKSRRPFCFLLSLHEKILGERKSSLLEKKIINCESFGHLFSRKSLLDSIFGLSEEMQKFIFKAFGLSEKKVKTFKPIYFSSLKKLRFEELILFVKDSKVFESIKMLNLLEKEVYECYFAAGLVDLSYDEFHAFHKFKVGLNESWEKRDYSFHIFSERLERYFGNC